MAPHRSLPLFRLVVGLQVVLIGVLAALGSAGAPTPAARAGLAVGCLGAAGLLSGLAARRERAPAAALAWAGLAAATVVLTAAAAADPTGRGLLPALVPGWVLVALGVLVILQQAPPPPLRSALWGEAGVALFATLAVGGAVLAPRGLDPVRVATLALTAVVVAMGALTRVRSSWTTGWAGFAVLAVVASHGADAALLCGALGIGLAAQPLDGSSATDRRRGTRALRPAGDLVTAGAAACLTLLSGAALGRPVPVASALLAVAAVALALLLLLVVTRPGREPGEGPAPGDAVAENGALADRQTLTDALAGGSGEESAVDGYPWSGWTDRIALLLLDLDRFKDVNEALGLEAGDEVLAQVGERLQAVLRPNQLLARLGGDEFAVLLPGVGREPAERVAEALRASLEAPVEVVTPAGRQAVYTRGSVGIATCRLPQGDPEDLLRQADVAVHRAKETGRGVEHFDPRRDRRGTQRLRRIGELRSALEHGDIEMHLQPQVDLATGSVVSAEALARWRHPKDGVLLPAAFLPLAAQTGLLRPVAAVLVERAVHAVAELWATGHRLPVSVNLSAADVLDPDLVARIPQLLESAGLPPQALRIEVTEDVLLSDAQAVARTLAEFRQQGMEVALDDYGTGYSSLAYLRDLPVDELKLDRSFAADLGRRRTATIVQHTVAMAHGLGMRVVAEGIETEAVAQTFAALRCDVGQGLHYGAAMTPQAFAQHLAALTVR